MLKWNAYICRSLKLGVLEWEAIGSDKQELSNQNNTVDNGKYLFK